MDLITISDGCLRAEIAPEKGGIVTQLWVDDVEFLYKSEENLRSPERPRCGVPFLFPAFGRMAGETYRWEGKDYPMAIHGFAHTSVWTVAEQAADRLVLTLAAADATLAIYPFRFSVTLEYRLEQGGLTIAQRYENRGKTPMPYAFGFHPYFRTENLEDVVVEADADARIDFSTGKALPFGHGTITLAEPETAPEVGAALAGLRSPVILHMDKAGRKLTMTFSPDFPQLVLWHPKNAPFLCTEPINGAPNGFNTGNHMTLAPGETREVTLHLKPEVL